MLGPYTEELTAYFSVESSGGSQVNSLPGIPLGMSAEEKATALRTVGVGLSPLY